VSVQKLFRLQIFVTDDSQFLTPCECIMNVVETIAIRYPAQQHKHPTVDTTEISNLNRNYI